MTKTPSAHALVTPTSAEPIGLGITSPLISPETELYLTAAFQLAWDNNAAHHLAENVLHLRRYRDWTQAKVAGLMKTSQGKIARIEGGDENVTLSTVTRIADALEGRLRFWIEPAECKFLSLPNWWDCLNNGWPNLAPDLQFHVVVTDDTGTKVGAVWKSEAHLDRMSTTESGYLVAASDVA
jgi:hypothetical protein